MSAGISVHVAPDLHAIVRPAFCSLAHLSIRRTSDGLDEALAEAAASARHANDAADVTTAVRAMYKAVGLDPTKVRPSSEALLRRVRRGEPLPRVNAAVDVVNWCSMSSHLPFGLYDADRVRGDVTLRLGRTDEAYAGIRKDVVHVGGRLTLADEDGPFGNPTSDSARTMVTPEATRLLVVIFAPVAVADARVEAALAATRDRLERYCGAGIR